MFARLLILFLATPVVEAALLLQIGEVIGIVPTVLLILVTGTAGSYLAKREGLSTWRRLNQKFKSGGLPGQELLNGAIILVAGALLITPGVLTDVVGFLGLIPFTRSWIRGYVTRRFKRAMRNGSVRTSWSSFDVSAPPPDAANETPTPEGAPNWQGTSREVPRHADKDTEEAGEPRSQGKED